MHNPFKPINRVLMGPGPANVHPQVLEALSKPRLGHLDPQFIELMDEIKGLLKYTFNTGSEHTFVLSGPGSLGMEACLVNLVEPGSKVIVCVAGYFAHRMTQIVSKLGGHVVGIQFARLFSNESFCLFERSLCQEPTTGTTGILTLIGISITWRPH